MTPIKNSILRFPMTILALSLAGCGGGGDSSGTAQPNNTARTEPTSFSLEVPGYTVKILGSPGGDCYAVALNDPGEVTGNCLNQNGGTDAVLWKTGGMEILARSAQARDINNHGEVVGWLDSPEGNRAFFHQGFLNLLNSPEGAARAMAVNDSGIVAGRLSSITEKAFLDQSGTADIIASEMNGYAVAMNNSGKVILKEVKPNSFHAHLWENGVLTALGNLGGNLTQGQGINSRGQVVGWSENSGGRYHAFLWENGTMIDLARTADEQSTAVAINDHGQILIKSATATENRTFLWSNGVFTDLGNFGSAFAEVTDMNNYGQIVGWLITEKGDIRAFLATPRLR